MIRADERYDKDLIVKDLMNINIDEKEEVSQMEKKQALEALKKSGLVAVIRKPKSDQIDAIAKALVQGGVGALEITLETPGALAMIKHLKEKYADQVLWMPKGLKKRLLPVLTLFSHRIATRIRSKRRSIEGKSPSRG